MNETTSTNDVEIITPLISPPQLVTPDPTSTEEAGKERPPISRVVGDYLSAIKNIAQTASVVMPHLSQWILDELKKNEERLSKYFPEGIDESDADNDEIRLESAHEFADFTTTIRNIEELSENRTIEVLSRSLFMQMFSEFDAFMGNFLKVIYLKNDSLLKGISREISLSDLLEYENIQAVKQVMLEKEVDTFRRDSYVEQFLTLEKKFSINLRKFKEWGEFVELSQRRNIFTHNGGAVSDQYLVVCDKEGWKFDTRPKVGDILEVDIEYFGRAQRVMSKVGFMLAYTLWSKIFPGELDILHNSINSTLYSCLEQERWKVAAELGEFSLSEQMRKEISEIDHRIRVVNVAIARKFSGNEQMAKQLLNSLDWSASYRDFKLAIAVLEDDLPEAVKLMRSIGKNGELIEQTSYHTWPLFHKFRENPEFYETYEEIYGEPYFKEISSDGKRLLPIVAEVDLSEFEEEGAPLLDTGATSQ